jgi:glycosyltransferase involved in cell wall biosynthesis
MARALHKRLIYDIYDFYADSHLVPSCLRWLTRNLEFWFIDRADAVIIADESRRVQLEGAKPRRLEVIYNTPEVVELRDVTRPHGSGLQIGYVGILSSQRGLTEVLDVLERHPEWNIDLAGYGDPQIVRRAEKLPNARFHGTVSYEQALELYARADVMIATYDPAVPNHRFSSPNKLFEAMMLGKPIIVAEGTSMDSVVRRNDLGFVVPYGDMEKLEEALAVIASWNLDKKEHFARRARQVYEQHFSWRLMQERLLQLYATLDAQEGKVNVRRRSV